MRLEEQLQQTTFDNAMHRLRVDILYSAGWLANQIKGFLSPYGITQKQFNILRILRGAHPDMMPIEEVRNRMIDKSSDVSRILDRLISKKLVKKKPCTIDKRSNRVCITDEGLALLREIDSNIQNLDSITNNLNQQEAEQLCALLEKMRVGDQTDA